MDFIEIETEDADHYIESAQAQADKDGYILCFHASPDAELHEIHENSPDSASWNFGGLFGANRTVFSFGYGGNRPVFYELRVKKDKYAESRDLWNVPDLRNRLASSLRTRVINGEQLDRIVEIVLNEEDCSYEDCRLFFNGDHDYVGWEIQRLRAFLAKSAGFLAVGTEDECGSIMYLPGAEIRLCPIQRMDFIHTHEGVPVPSVAD